MRPLPPVAQDHRIETVTKRFKEAAMIKAGDTLMNPVTKERMTFLKTAAETNGDYVLIELRAAPGGVVAAAHVHPSQTETFEVLRGTLGAKIGRKTVEARAEDVLVVEPRVAHKWWNAGEDELVFRCEVRPALQFEQLIETMFSLAADGKTNKKGMPNPMRLAVIANHHFEDVQLPVVPRWMQKAALALGAPLGRSLGFQPTYVPAGETAAATA
jgi:quercetin dioxygenase-like cupin family protein